MSSALLVANPWIDAITPSTVWNSSHGIVQVTGFGLVQGSSSTLLGTTTDYANHEPMFNMYLSTLLSVNGVGTSGWINGAFQSARTAGTYTLRLRTDLGI